MLVATLKQSLFMMSRSHEAAEENDPQSSKSGFKNMMNLSLPALKT